VPKSAITFDVKGLKELDTQLRQLDGKVATRIGRKAVRDPANLLRTVLSLTAPYRTGRRLKGGQDWGHLRDNLKVVSVKARKRGLILYRVSTGDAFWGNFLELGTVAMSPRPWMRPQVDALTPEIVTMQIDTLRLGITREAKKAARAAPMQ